ncbi:four-carbon acid sugar kinase family protein [Rhizobium sp. NZLR3b]|uniref:four-carbon acid sugar kinase family protein n=1 Tax=unclassified Rhizobium TaxID=2613769 RepID=UPI001C83A0AB|nr:MULTISPECIES: four-carbon acid sugar kinase family protein [unclassified Rhizobium]MBX5156437.1 four-carbon acid sugar kinase family protein [Rhizobium sp. NZLR8]MBX5185630.1 four-carbon acid sugar kinase family protein [Rhizobium sp. NZLR5]MBX5187419.1 four-carbon acid sugar kinase family protein [Rhizobium sp. NZLR3b]MBX5193813.1 four-carbon acid sugar kinase family protein [Rhizobium sp. NZLR10]
MDRLLVSYYGDDFTGSTDVMEALASNGVETALFLDIPTPGLLARFKHCRAIGIAGTSRSETPDWMEEHLAPAFDWLKSLGAAICHYKVCSTFDSSPEIGNIGKAIEIGRTIFGQSIVPVIVGAPQLKRYTAFGNLFAAYQGRVFRIDRHPVMSRHPVTPMDEADLTVHLSKQTSLPVLLADLVTITAADADQRIDALASSPDGILLLDVDSEATQIAAGGQMLRVTSRSASFVAGSSGVEYALLSAWRRAGLIGASSGEFPDVGPVDRLAVVSGSVSPTTERQIRTAVENGFESIALDPLTLVSNGEGAVDGAIQAGIQKLKEGKSVILYTALGPSADRGADIDRLPGARHRLGSALGTILCRLVEAEGLSRAVVAGGDTSSHALRQLKIDALTTLLPLPQTPGSPLCLAHGDFPPTNGLQIALKGGQVGTDGYFAQIRDGRKS